YGQLKKTYMTVTALKSKLGLIWDDEKGMNVMLDWQLVWDDLVKVHEHLSCLSTMSSHYQNNPEFKVFANKGWLHYEHMAPLMPSKAKGTH
ncbi:hypothetical protein BJV74DRAFT_728580, partial [Russula compacta]